MNLEIEQRYGHKVVAGVDEAGRGPLAGPVIAAAVIIDPAYLIPGINDSKKLTKLRRQQLYAQIIKAYEYGIGIVGAREIEEINILQATIKASKLAIENLPTKPDIVLIDGNMKFNQPNYHSIIRGDQLSLSIAAASIVAKVTRDNLMSKLAQQFPEYNWQQNAGYGTLAHRQAIYQHGVTIHHRRTFKLI